MVPWDSAAQRRSAVREIQPPTPSPPSAIRHPQPPNGPLTARHPRRRLSPALAIHCTPLSTTMSPLAVRPGRNAARQAKKLKEIRHVKGAIRWAERARKQRKEISADRFEAKQVVVGRVKWEADNVHRVRREALRNAAEDWKMGPLRPNRAIGAGKDKYGALNVQQVQKPQIPTKFVKQRNELREKRGQELQYPLVVDDEKYFPIVTGDRVTIIKGRDAGRIGKVREVLPRTHEVVVEGLNKVRTPPAPPTPVPS
jgi:large subunit ribosomal protein L24